MPSAGWRQHTPRRCCPHSSLISTVPPVMNHSAMHHMCLERCLKGRDQRLKLVARETGQIQKLCRAILAIGILSMRHRRCLLFWEAQYTINRDNLRYVSMRQSYATALQPGKALLTT